MTIPSLDPLQRVLFANSALDESGGDNDQKAWDLNDAISHLMKVTSAEEFIEHVRERRIPRTNRTTFGSLITLAAQNGQGHLIEPLLAVGCDPSVKDFDDLTPLERTIADLDGPHGVPPVLALIKSGAQMDQMGNILRFASSCGKAYIVKALLELGHDPNERCPVAKCTSLTGALQNLSWPDSVWTVEALLAAGAACGNETPATAAKPSESEIATTALRTLVTQRGTDADRIEQVLDLLIEYGADINAGGATTPLVDSVNAKADAAAVCLLGRGAHPEQAPLRHMSTFQTAAVNGMIKTVQYMLTHFGEDPNQTLYNGKPLAEAVNDEATRTLLLSSAAMNSVLEPLGAPVADAVAPARPRSTLSL